MDEINLDLLTRAAFEVGAVGFLAEALLLGAAR